MPDFLFFAIADTNYRLAHGSASLPTPFAGNQSSALGSVEGFNLARKKWEPLPPMPTGRCSCSSLEAANLLFVIGGVAQGPSSAVEALCLQEGV